MAAFIGNLGTPPNTGSAQYINEQEVPDLFIATGVNAFADAETLPWTSSSTRTTLPRARFSPTT